MLSMQADRSGRVQLTNPAAVTVMSRRFGGLAVFPTIFLLIFLLPSAVLACPYSIRDVGFVDVGSGPYRVYCFLKDATPNKESLASTFDRVSGAVFTDCNVQSELVNLDQQPAHPAVEYVRFWEIESFPAAILVSPAGRSMVLPLSGPQKTFEQTLWSALEAVVSSPAREELVANIVKAWCVVLLVEGKDAADNARARKAVKDAIEGVARTMNQAGKPVDEKPHLIVLSPESSTKEEALLWSLALEQDESRGPRAAVLYGRGRQLGPVLEGETLTENSLFYVLNTVGMNCGCETAPSWLSGPQIPLRWGEKMRAQAVKHLGFDPENPMVKMAVSQVWSGAEQSPEETGIAFAYSEGLIESESGAESSGPGKPSAQTRDAAGGVQRATTETEFGVGSGSPSALQKRVGKLILFLVGGMIFLVGLGSVFIILLARNKSTS